MTWIQERLARQQQPLKPSTERLCNYVIEGSLVRGVGR